MFIKKLSSLSPAQAKPAGPPKNFAELLAKLFTDSEVFKGTYSPDGFTLDNYENALVYDPDGLDEPENFDGKPFGIELNACQNANCCGLLDFGGFGNLTKDPAINDVIIRLYKRLAADKYNCILSTVTSKQVAARTALANNEFYEATSFTSKSTRAAIVVMVCRPQRDTFPLGHELEGAELYVED